MLRKFRALAYLYFWEQCFVGQRDQADLPMLSAPLRADLENNGDRLRVFEAPGRAA